MNDMDKVCQFQKLTMGATSLNYNWDLVSRYQQMTEDEIRTHKNKVNWNNIFTFHKGLSTQFINEFNVNFFQHFDRSRVLLVYQGKREKSKILYLV